MELAHQGVFVRKGEEFLQTTEDMYLKTETHARAMLQCCKGDRGKRRRSPRAAAAAQ